MYFLLFVVISVAVLVVFDFNPITELKKAMENKKIDYRGMLQREKREKIVGRKIGRSERRRIQTQQALKLSNSKLAYQDYVRIEILCGVAGAATGLFLGNIFLAVVLAVCLPFIPHQTLQFKIVSYKKAVAESLESVLALLTNSYRSEDNFIAVVEKNIKNFKPPFRQVFAEFLLSVNLIDTNIQRSILKMRDKIDNPFFYEWCNMLIQCQDDRDLKSALPNIVTKMNTVKRMQIEADSMMYGIWKEYIMIVIIAVAVIPLIKFMNKSWFAILVTSTVGKAVLAVTALVIFLATFWVIKVNKPINIR